MQLVLGEAEQLAAVGPGVGERLAQRERELAEDADRGLGRARRPSPARRPALLGVISGRASSAGPASRAACLGRARPATRRWSEADVAARHDAGGRALVAVDRRDDGQPRGRASRRWW